MLCIFNTFTSKYFHFAHVILTMLSSTYHFWGVHNLYQLNRPNSIVKLVCFSFFAFCFFFIFFRYSFFAFRYSISLFVIHFWSFTFCIRFSFFSFRFSFFWHSKSGPVSYFDIQTEVEYTILTFKILFWHSNWGRISNFDIQNPILKFKIGPKIVFWHSKSYFDIRAETEYRVWHSKSYFGIQTWPNTYFDIQNPISTFELGPNIEFWH